MQWVTPRNQPEFVSMSADGYYGIAAEQLQGDGAHRMTRYAAYHIEAVWARPHQIGGAATIVLAQAVCEVHATQPRSAHVKRGHGISGRRPSHSCAARRHRARRASPLEN
jgi:hypothetical protein